MTEAERKQLAKALVDAVIHGLESYPLDKYLAMLDEHEHALADAEWRGRHDVQHVLGPFSSGGDWGKWKAWLVEGAPTHEEGVFAAQLITRLQCRVDEYLAQQEAPHGG